MVVRDNLPAIDHDDAFYWLPPTDRARELHHLSLPSQCDHQCRRTSVVVTSSPASGSSRMITSGLCISAAMSISRCLHAFRVRADGLIDAALGCWNRRANRHTDLLACKACPGSGSRDAQHGCRYLRSDSESVEDGPPRCTPRRRRRCESVIGIDLLAGQEHAAAGSRDAGEHSVWCPHLLPSHFGPR